MSAHRHGNDLALLASAEEAGADLVEVDVHLYRGRLEARHEKTVGPVPLVFERGVWRLQWNPARLPFDAVLAVLGPDTRLHIDLKGWDRRLSRQVAERMGARSYVVSSRVWWLLGPFRTHAGAQIVRSIGARWQRWFFLRWVRTGSPEGAAIRSDLLTARSALAIKERTSLLLVWRIDDRAQVEELQSWGADGVIVDSLPLAVDLLSRRATQEADRR